MQDERQIYFQDNFLTKNDNENLEEFQDMPRLNFGATTL